MDHPIVIDNGSGMCKAGFAGDKTVRVFFTPVVGRPKQQGNDVFIGDEAEAKRGVLNLECPIERGYINSWDDMELIWQHALKELQTDGKNSILMTETALNKKGDREKTTELIFEKFNTSSFYLINTSVLALYASGRLEGVVLDSGHGVSHTAAVSDGYIQPESVIRADLGGIDITEYLSKNINEKCGIELAETDAQEIKHKLCQISQNFDEEKIEATEFQLPDGQLIKIGAERFAAPESLFKPSILGRGNTVGIHEMVQNTAAKHSKAESELTVVVAGGGNLFPGFHDRLEKELAKNKTLKVLSPPERLKSVWMGGSILAQLDDFKPMWITKQEYADSGPSIVHKKCR